MMCLLTLKKKQLYRSLVDLVVIDVELDRKGHSSISRNYDREEAKTTFNQNCLSSRTKSMVIKKKYYFLYI